MKADDSLKGSLIAADAQVCPRCARWKVRECGPCDYVLCSDCAASSTFAEEMGEHLRTLRELRGFTQAQCARALGISRTAYLGVEAGSRALGFFEAVILSACFGVPLSGLLPRRVARRKKSETL